MWTIQTALPGHASDGGILSVPEEMQHHLNQENSSCLKAAQMKNQDNVTIQTSLKLLCTSAQSPHHTPMEPHLQEIITSLAYTIYKLIKLLQSFNMDRFSLVSLFKQMWPTEQIQIV